MKIKVTIVKLALLTYAIILAASFVSYFIPGEARAADGVSWLLLEEQRRSRIEDANRYHIQQMQAEQARIQESLTRERYIQEQMLRNINEGWNRSGQDNYINRR